MEHSTKTTSATRSAKATRNNARDRVVKKGNGANPPAPPNSRYGVGDEAPDIAMRSTETSAGSVICAARWSWSISGVAWTVPQGNRTVRA